MERIIKTAAKFGTKTAVCINKFDTNLENTDKIEKFCTEQGLSYVGKIPFDDNAVKAVNNGQSIVDIDCSSGAAAKEVYTKTIKILVDEMVG